MTLKQFDSIQATFQPQQTDDLQPDALPWVGAQTLWQAMFVIEEGPYEGQWAMAPNRFGAEKLPVLAWVPECDLVDIRGVRLGDDASEMRSLKAEPKVHLSYRLNSSAPVQVNPEAIVKQLGISYERAIPQSVSDSWWFLNCENVPSELPEYIKPMTLEDKELKRWLK